MELNQCQATIYLMGNPHARYRLSPNEEKPCSLARVVWIIAAKGVKVEVQ